MNRSYYSYFQEEYADGSIVYNFQTRSGAVYSVYFRPNEYDKYLDAFPNLLQKGYAFGFYKVIEDITLFKGKDLLIAPTIMLIVKDFIAGNNKETVLFYHCDYSDDKQAAREKIFSKW